MPILWTFLGTVLGMYLLVFGLRYFLVWRYYIRLRLTEPNAVAESLADEPAYMSGVFRASEAWMSTCGFVFQGCVALDGIFVGAENKQRYRVYIHPQELAYAFVSIAKLPTPQQPAMIEFVSYFADGHRVVTLNGLVHGLIGRYPQTTMIDPYADDWHGQWQAHQAAVQARGAAPIACADPAAALQASLNAYLAAQLAAGLFARTANGHYRMRVLPAMRVARGMIRSVATLKAFQARQAKAAAGLGAVDLDIPIEVEVEAYQAIAATTRSRTGVAAKLVIFVVSMALFGLSLAPLGLGFSPGPLAILIGVLVFHELGHLAGMLAFGYRQLNIVFVPFLGAATMGVPQQPVTDAKRAIVYLLGPIPGIVLGFVVIGIYLKTRSPLALEIAAMLLALNYINLLPLMPLDGGHVMKLALFSRFPLLQVGFGLASAITLILIGVLLPLAKGIEPVFFFLGFVVIIGLPQEYRVALAAHRLRGRPHPGVWGDLPGDGLVAGVFRVLREPPYALLGFQHKFWIAKRVIEHHGGGGLGLVGALLTLTVYGVTLLAPLGIYWAVH